MTIQLADRYQQIADPTVTKLLELTNSPGVISFAGGIPAPATFPIRMVEEAQAKAKLNLQYSSVQGMLELREAVSQWLSRDWGREVTAEQVLITTGSQQALDLVGRTFLNPGETVLVEDPTYFVALYALSAYGVRYRTIDWKKPSGLRGAKLA